MLALIPLLPLAGFVINAFLGRRLPKTVSGGLACLAMLGAFAVSVLAVLQARGAPEHFIQQTLFQWIASGDLKIPVALRVDPLSSGMILVVPGIGSLPHNYFTPSNHQGSGAGAQR